MRTQTHYEVLGVDPRASGAEILAAFRQHAMRCHPDRNPQADAHDAFVALSAAYRVLSDHAQRAAYDRHGGVRRDLAVARTKPAARAGGRASVAPQGAPQRSQPRSDGAPSTAPAPPPRKLHLTRAELAVGCRRVLDFAWIAACAPCAGTGKAPDDGRGCGPCAGTGRSFVTGFSAPCVPCAGTGDPAPRACVDCGGTGRVPHREQVVLEVPAGCAAGALLTLRGGRPDPARPGSRCDLVLRLVLDTAFTEHGRD